MVDRVSIKVQSKIDKKYFRLGMFEAHNHDLHQSKDDSDAECTRVQYKILRLIKRSFLDINISSCASVVFRWMRKAI